MSIPSCAMPVSAVAAIMPTEAYPRPRIIAAMGGPAMGPSVKACTAATSVEMIACAMLAALLARNITLYAAEPFCPNCSSIPSASPVMLENMLRVAIL
ncbi:hypothetical protein D3C79_878930 [compost metagenome]